MTLPPSYEKSLRDIETNQLELAGIGCFAQIIKAGDTGLVVKKENPHPVLGNLQPIEKQIYERLGDYPHILRYYGEYQSDGLLNGLVFQYLPGGTLSENLALSNYPKERTRWPIQAAEALSYIHSKNVIHCDFGSHNFLIREDGSLALADFGGSTIDDSTSEVGYATRYQRPSSMAEKLSNSTEKDDLFALGTVLYEIITGNQIFSDISSRAIRRRFEEHEYPDLTVITDTNVRKVIMKCWECEYKNAEEVSQDLRASRSATRLSHLSLAGISLGTLVIIFAMARYKRS